MHFTIGYFNEKNMFSIEVIIEIQTKFWAKDITVKSSIRQAEHINLITFISTVSSPSGKISNKS